MLAMVRVVCWKRQLTEREARMGEPAGRTGESAEPIVMAEQPLGVRPCSVAAALDILGERWSLLAVREISYGVHTFARIAAYTGASRDILADRLGQLGGAGGIGGQ